MKFLEALDWLRDNPKGMIVRPHKDRYLLNKVKLKDGCLDAMFLITKEDLEGTEWETAVPLELVLTEEYT